MRIPGEGTDQLINRRQEPLYIRRRGRRICDEIAYITRRTATKSQNISKVRGSAMQKMRKIFRNA